MNYYYYYMDNRDQNEFYRHPSPLCSAMYEYKQKCGYSCKRNSKRKGSAMFSGFGGYNDGYNFLEMAAMWVLTFTGRSLSYFNFLPSLFCTLNILFQLAFIQIKIGIVNKFY